MKAAVKPSTGPLDQSGAGLAVLLIATVWVMMGCSDPEEEAHRRAVAACGLSTSQTSGFDTSWNQCERVCYYHQLGDSFAEFYCSDIRYCGGLGAWGRCRICATFYPDTSVPRTYTYLIYSCEG